MYIEKPKRKMPNGKVYTQILLRESYREDGKVKKRTLANLTNRSPKQVAAIAVALKDKSDDKLLKNNLKSGKNIGLSMIVVFIMKLLGVLKAFDNNFEAKIAKFLVVARVVLQSSRLQALYWSEEDEVLNLLEFNKNEKLDNKNIYLGLDYVYENKSVLEEKLFKIYYGNKPPKKVFYDVTSSYVEGDYEMSELVRYGYNRDKKVGKKQIVIGLLTDEFGHAISCDTYPGNTNDIKTFIDQLNRLKYRFKLKNITIVGDGGMIKNEDIATIKEYGYEYITSIGKPSIRKLLKDNSIEMSLFDEELSEVIEKEKGVRYILRCNPTRAKEIAKNRLDKIDAIRELAKQKTNYYNTHLKATKEKFINDINSKIKRLKLSSFLSIEVAYEEGKCIDEDGNQLIDAKGNEKRKELATLTIKIDEKELKEISKLDGCYVIKTSITNLEHTKEEIHKNYKTLIKVENAFKTLKTEFLEFRPIYLRTDSRIKGHVFISMVAYNIVLKIKGHIKNIELDFKRTMRRLNQIQTIKNEVSDIISYKFILPVSDEIQKLFKEMKFKMPKMIDWD